MKSEEVALRICGNCRYANRTLDIHELKKLKTIFGVRKQNLYLTLLRRYPNPLRNVKVHCIKENIEVGVLEGTCAFWKRK